MYRFFMLYFLFSISSPVFANAVNGWPNGSASYKKIHAAASKDERPLLVYFYTDWCSYCKRLNREYINTAPFRELSGGLYKVQINPEKSKSAEKLFKAKYRGTGYPTVIVSVPGLSKDVQKYHPFSSQGDMTPSQYVDQIRAAIAREYNQHAYSLFEKKQYKRAREYLYQALTYDHVNKYALILIGRAYEYEANHKKDRSLFAKARKVYEKALSIYPKDKEILKDLNRLVDLQVNSEKKRLKQKYYKHLLPGNPNETEIFLLTFAGDASQSVFKRETLFIQNLFKKVYNTYNHSLALINHKSTLSKYQLATAKNLQVALDLFSVLMNDDDILYLYFTSHGTREHELFVNFEPHAEKDFGPNEIRSMLDKAGIKWRVIVVSACYSGGFIEALKTPYTLLATASDATHKSFGCSETRDFTYYGEAIYKRLMSNGAGIVDSLDKARSVVYKMERELNSFPHSNPQFWQGKEIQNRLKQLNL